MKGIPKREEKGLRDLYERHQRTDTVSSKYIKIYRITRKLSARLLRNKQRRLLLIDRRVDSRTSCDLAGLKTFCKVRNTNCIA